MKKLVFCFDGTWNDIKSNGEGTSNVAKLAAMLDNVDDDENPQVIHYDTGVGTGRRGRMTEGATGKGVLENVREAYLFLCMNYVKGDEISVFGFSRGAFTARSFAGLIGKCGIMRRAQIERAIEATELYTTRAKMKTDEEQQYLEDCFLNLKFASGCDVNTCVSDVKAREQFAGIQDGEREMIKITYLGLWDTVGAMIDFDRSDVDFHIIDLPECAQAARHAVAIDEYRPHFDIDLLDNIESLNKRVHRELGEEAGSLEEYHKSPDRAFQEVWFPGEHGSVGGAGDVLGLSDEALLWVLEGAIKHAGLKIDTDSEVSKVFGLRPTPMAPLDNTIKDSLKESLMERALNRHFRERKKGPRGIHEVSRSAIIRYGAPANTLPENREYRPQSLDGLEKELREKLQDFLPGISDKDYRLYNGYDVGAEMITLGQPGSADDVKLRFYTVRAGETLGKIAERIEGYISHDLQELNKVMVPDADDVFVGQILNIPDV